jgi:hypothetical protein
MIKHNQDGAVSGLLISLIFAIILLIGSVVTGAWAFSGMQKYKNNANGLIQTAVQAAQSKDAQAQQVALAQAAKQPYTTYTGTEQYGNITFEYPKTWSAYNAVSGDNSNPINAYFMPGMLNSVSDGTGVFALRVEVLSQAYAPIVQGYAQQTDLTSIAYALPKLPNTVGVEVSGPIDGPQAPPLTMVILPDRTNTIEIWTVGNTYLSDFNNVILKNFSFSP